MHVACHPSLREQRGQAPVLISCTQCVKKGSPGHATITEGTPPFGRNVARGSGRGREGDRDWGLLLRAISIKMMWASNNAN